MFATPINAPSANVEMRVSHLFKWTAKLDRILSRVGLALPLRFIAWVAGRSIQARIDGRWETVQLSADEVMTDAFR
jgi:hypothetical protein